MAIMAPKMPYKGVNIVSAPPLRCYYQNNVLMPREYGDGYMSDPIANAERIVRLIALHDNLTVPLHEIVLGKTF